MKDLRVVQSFRAPRATTNPYITMLDAALSSADGIDYRRFDWWTAILGRYDVFHWHWPEAKLEGRSWWKSWGKHFLVLLIMFRHRFSRVAVVRTVHNVELPDVGAFTRWMLTRIEAQTTFRILLNETTQVPPGSPSRVILHGDYRPWFARQDRSERVTGQVGYFGGVRRYKSVGGLVTAYRQALASTPEISLRIGGRPSSVEIANDLEAQVADLPGVTLDLHFLSDAELVDVATSSDLIVLAYRFMHNSGSVLAALSLGRPVLVPANEANAALAREVGDDWVLQYEGDLDGHLLVGALRAAQSIDPASAPDLSRRSWEQAGSAHVAAYRDAVAARRHVQGAAT